MNFFLCSDLRIHRRWHYLICVGRTVLS